MNPRITGILFLIAAALGAFVYFYEIRGEEGRLEAEARQKRLFPDVEDEAVEWLALTTSDGRPVRAERREKGWQIVEPLVFPGDEFALDGMASALAQIASAITAARAMGVGLMSHGCSRAMATRAATPPETSCCRIARRVASCLPIVRA